MATSSVHDRITVKDGQASDRFGAAFKRALKTFGIFKLFAKARDLK
ncbi:MAG: hypothetical protein LBP26_01120 [Clostridiales bacterium]|jgi:hypothetical protein|nr:hypothetical protein [Clostridiales bacterium]